MKNRRIIIFLLVVNMLLTSVRMNAVAQRADSIEIVVTGLFMNCVRYKKGDRILTKGGLVRSFKGDESMREHYVELRQAQELRIMMAAISIGFAIYPMVYVASQPFIFAEGFDATPYFAIAGAATVCELLIEASFNKKLKRAIRYYNSRFTSDAPIVRLGINSSGIGLTLKF